MGPAAFVRSATQRALTIMPIARLEALQGALRPQYVRVSWYDDEGKVDRTSTLSRRVRILIGLAVASLALVLLLPLHRHLSWGSYHGITISSAAYDAAEKHLIIASFTAQNVSWLSEIPSSWTIKRYFMDDPNPEQPGLSVPRNQGREAMAYLTYIVDHYDTLPNYMVFTHGHERSWHQVEPLQMKIRALNLAALEKENYISLRCGDQMGCEKQPYIDTRHPNWGGEKHMCDFWKTIVPHESCPRYVSYKCCAQHAVTRAAVRKRSKQDWIRIREPLLHDLSDNKAWGEGATDWLGGMYYEKFWHILLGTGPEYCPSIETCQQVHFSNAIICDGDIDLTVFEGTAWKETSCVSAFDGIDKDAPAGPAIEHFHKELLNIYADTRRKAAERHKKQQDVYNNQYAG